MVALEPQLLLEELGDLLPGESRNAKIGRMRWGLTTGQPKTLEATGKEFDLTRERVRQIAKRLKRRFEGRTAYLPTTETVVNLLSELGGASRLSAWGELAYDRGLSETAVGPRALLELADMGLAGLPRLHVHGSASDPIVAVSEVDVIEYKRIGPAVAQSLRRFGLIDIDRLTTEVRNLGGEMEPDEVRGFVRSLPELTPLAGGRFYVHVSDPRTPLWRGVRKMLWVAGSLPIDTLTKGLSRTRPGRDSYAIKVSAELLRELFERSPLIEQRGGDYHWVGASDGVHLAGSESALLQLFRAEGPVLMAGRIREVLQAQGYSLPTVTGLLQGSLLIERLGFATYALVGSVRDDVAFATVSGEAVKAESERRELRRLVLEGDMASKLREATIEESRLFLDPNNPRFADLDTLTRPVPVERVHEDTVQQRAMGRMLDDRFEVQQLQESIRSIGFLTVDRLVVLELPQPESFMVIEGNRRLAAVKALLDDERGGEIDLEDEVRESLETIPVMVIDDPDPEARNYTARVLQGVRHVASVKPWGPYQQAQLVGLMLEEGQDVADIKETLGLTAARINSLRRVYYAREQMRADPEYGDLAKPGLFSNFEEALKLPKVRTWLEWDDAANKALNAEHRQMLYSWFVGIEEDGVRLPAKIVDAKDIRKLPALFENPVAFQRFAEDPALSLADAARASGVDDSPHLDWRAIITANLATLENVPALDLRDASDADVELLDRVKQTVDALLKQLEFARHNA
jgi:hypothetical protein